MIDSVDSIKKLLCSWERDPGTGSLIEKLSTDEPNGNGIEIRKIIQVRFSILG